MTPGDKELLLKDLCARLPYNPLVEYKGESYNVLGIAHGRLVLCKPFMSYTLNEHPLVEEVKPYLFLISSMTEEQKYEYNELIHSNNIKAIEGFITSTDCSTVEIDWLLKNNFDFRGLIPIGLANDATGLNIY